MIKKFAFALLPAIALVACGDDDSGSGTIDFEDSFEMVLNKASYEYDDEDSTFKLIKPVCKVERPGNLMGPEDVDEWDTTSYRAREKKGNITLKHGDEELKSDGTLDLGYRRQRFEEYIRSRPS